ncbi:MAG TPA: TetR/AcrR family transcriptional regulator [Micromonosporaceae bacterium]
MAEPATASSPRREELLDQAYRYALRHGLVDLSLRPLAAAIGSSPRVLLFLFGSKDGLVRALLARARADELALLDQARRDVDSVDLAGAVRVTWQWLVDPRHRQLLVLWLEAYARSLSEPDGPWADFARQTVHDWLALLSEAQRCDAHPDDGDAAAAERALALAVLRGALLDLLATGDTERATAAVERYLALTAQPR